MARTNPFRSTAYRVALVYSVAFALVMLLLGMLAYAGLRDTLIRQLDISIHNEVAELTAEYREDGLVGLRQAIGEREVAGISSNLGYAVFDAAGKRIAGHLSMSMPEMGATRVAFNDPREGVDQARAMVEPLRDGMRLVVAADLEPIERIDTTMLSILGIAIVAVLILGIGGGLLLGGYLRRRLGSISRAAHAIMAGNLEERIQVSPRNDEIDELAVTLNRMLDRIGELLENLKQVSSDIAHDLRRPLSHLANRLELALADETDEQAMKQAVTEARQLADELLSLFAAILRIAEVESGQLQQAFQTFDLSELAIDLCQSYAPAFEDEVRELTWDIEPDVALWGDRELIAQAIVNLLENALKHTPVNTRVSVSLTQQEGARTLIIDDDGPGVPPADRQRIIGRFVRLETARHTPGNGLGLNLVSAVAVLHGGELQFSDNAPGLRAILVLGAAR